MSQKNEEYVMTEAKSSIIRKQRVHRFGRRRGSAAAEIFVIGCIKKILSKAEHMHR